MNPLPVQEQGRGELVLALGILSILLFGPVLGIPAWVMGQHDLKKIKTGAIAISQRGLTRSGMILGIIGTFVSVLTIIVVGMAISTGISMFKSNAMITNRDDMLNDLNNLAAKAQQYYRKPASMGGGGGTFQGFVLSQMDAENGNGVYWYDASAPKIYENPPLTDRPFPYEQRVIYIVGRGNETGRDGVDKVEAYVEVSPNRVTARVLN